MTSLQRQIEKKVVINEDPDMPPQSYFIKNAIYKVRARNQIVAALICNLGMFCFGCAIGWNSPSVEKLEKIGFFSSNQVTLSGSLISIGALLALPIFGFISSKFGRKAGGYFTGIVFVIGFALKINAKSPTVLLMGRLLCGLAGGSSTTLPTLYIGESAQPEYRGLLSSLMMVEYGVGILFTFTISIFVDPHFLALVLLPGPIIFLIGFWFMPETPSQNLRQGDEEGAAKSLAWFRQLPLNCEQLNEELADTAEQLGISLPIDPSKKKRFFIKISEKSKSSKEERHIPITKEVPKTLMQAKKGKNFIHMIKLLFTTNVGLSGLHITFTLVTAQTFTGLFAIATYTKNIFIDAGSPISTDLSSILYAVFFLAGSSIGCVLMDKAGRRITSSAIVFVCHVSLAISLKLIGDGNKGVINYIPLIALPLSVLAYNMGIAVIPFVVVSEIFDLEVKDLATTIIMTYVWSSVFILLSFFPTSVKNIGLASTFWIFAVVALWSTIYFYFFLIETKGKPLEQILYELSGTEKVQRKSFYDLNRCDRSSKLILYSFSEEDKKSNS